MDDGIKDIKEQKDLKAVEIQSFIVTENPEGLKIKMQNGMELSVSRNLPQWVKGTVKIDGQVVPIIDLEAKKGEKPQEISSTSCMIIKKQNHGKHIIFTGTFHEDTSAILEIIRK